MRIYWGWILPQNIKSKVKATSFLLPKIKLIPIIDTHGCGIERKKRIQSLLSQMLLRAAKRGRPVTVKKDGELENAS